MIKENLENLYQKMTKAAQKSGRGLEDVHLIAVTKSRNLEVIDKAYSLGLSNFGENRVQELQEKIAQRPEYKWHMIGSLQSNKVKYIIDKVDLIHSLDRKSLAKGLQKRAADNSLAIKALVQVNVSGEESKSGIKPENLEDFLIYLEKKKNIDVLGLMTMAPYTKDEKVLRSVFKGLRELRDNMNRNVYQQEKLKELSMGMSNDYEIAIEEGATIIRVGSSIFGDYDYN